MWECESEVACECGALTSSNQRLEDDSLSLRRTVSFTSILAATKEQCFIKWSALVERYTFCLLTRDEDRLPALGGLARLFELSGLRLYRAGLWREFIPRGLLWRVKNPLNVRRPVGYIAPSWSWASLVGHVDWDLCFAYRLRYPGMLLDCETSPSGPDPFGKVGGGFLRMRTGTWETKLEYQPATGFMALACGESAYFDINAETKTSTFYQYQMVKCILVAEGNSVPGQGPSTLLALVVREVGRKADIPQYARIGLATLDHTRLSDFSDETVVII